MEILWWLAPPVVVTLLAIVAISWLDREPPEVDRDEALRRLGVALAKEHRGATDHRTAPTRVPDRASGVAVRRTEAGAETRRSA